MGILIFISFFCLALGAPLLLWDAFFLGGPATLDEYERFLRVDPARFAHLLRVSADHDHLLSDCPEIRARFRRERRQVRRLILQDLDKQFRAITAVGVMLAGLPKARELNFGSELLRWRVAFGWGCVRARLAL